MTPRDLIAARTALLHKLDAWSAIALGCVAFVLLVLRMAA